MNTETIAFGLTEHAGIACLILLVLFAGATELIRSGLERSHRRQPVRPSRCARLESPRARRRAP